MRQIPKTHYCEQCACPMDALAPPRMIGLAQSRPQRLPVWPAPGPLREQAALGGSVLGIALGWLPLPGSLLLCCLSVLLGSMAVVELRRKRRRCVPLWLAWIVVALGAAASVPATSAWQSWF